MVRDGRVKAVNGSLVAVQADSICLHGDGPHAVVFAEKIRQELLAAGIKVSA
ncbi:LamB/YcsF family protein [Klebsiella pneumoniae]|nr:LamB/YcsF family protein [Klebsiella pneumoniae]